MENKPDTLVIGGTGLVGSHLLWLLAQQGPVMASGRTEKKPVAGSVTIYSL